MVKPLIYIIILNWNGWKDTIECLESIQSLKSVNYCIVIVDNFSENDSVEKIKSWTNGEVKVASNFVTYKKNKKPLNVVEYDKYTAELGGTMEEEQKLSTIPADQKLVLIKSNANLGFAGGNNVGIRYALAKNDFDYIWILNNDTVVNPDALDQMVIRMEADSGIGICGSTLLYYYEPQKIQALGGATYNKWLGTIRHIGAYQNKNIKVNNKKIEGKMDYVVGASMLVSKEFLQKVGLLSEEYFLYFEEIDWAVRAKGKFELGFAPKSIVYHKEGRSIGTNGNPKMKSSIADYYAIRNRILFTRKFYPYVLCTVYLGLLVTLLNRLLRRQTNRIPLIWKAILDKSI